MTDERTTRLRRLWSARHDVAGMLVPVVAVLLLALSFASYYRYSYARPIQRLCTPGGPTCRGTLLERDAWHGFFGWFAVVLAVLAAACVVASRLDESLRRVLSYVTIALSAASVGCLCAVIVVVPDLGGPVADLVRTLRVPYRDIVENHHAWGFWVSFAVAIVGLAAAVLDVGGVRPAAEPDDDVVESEG